MTPHNRNRARKSLAWLSTIAAASILGLGAGTLLRAAPAAPNARDALDLTLVRALGSPTGVLAVVNPVNCALTARDAATLNAVASIPGVRVTVLLLAVQPHDSLIARLRQDFGFAPAVVVVPAGRVNPKQLPEIFRMPFIAVVARGQLRYAAWGQSLKNLHLWLPVLAGAPSAADILTASAP